MTERRGGKGKEENRPCDTDMEEGLSTEVWAGKIQGAGKEGKGREGGEDGTDKGREGVLT